MRSATLLLCALSLAAGCSGSAPEEPAAVVTPPDRSDPAVLERRRAANARPLPERVAPDVDAPGTGEAPAALLERLRADLEVRTGGAPAELVRAEAVHWPDGSLGCPVPGRVYTQARIRGYQVVFEVAGRRYDYRITEGGYFVLCEGGLPQGF
ncbi:MAG: hypothetical protein V2J24_14155 [Pseudomonadales bacterium]|jgi:hypothetical protein|nr:hypothetical protein [Pseudomonadales bacterium]